jgi:hypothetical protein
MSKYISKALNTINTIVCIVTIVTSNKRNKNMMKHKREGCDDLVFVDGENKGSSADVFCVINECDMGAFTDEHGNVIPHSIAKVGFKEEGD